MDLLKEIEHNEINNLMFFASVHGLNCKRILQILIVLLTAIQDFLQTKIIQISKTKNPRVWFMFPHWYHTAYEWVKFSSSKERKKLL